MANPLQNQIPMLGDDRAKVANYSNDDEAWYHYSCMAKIYADQGIELPDSMLEWASKQQDVSDYWFFMEPVLYRRIPLLKLICIYGVHFGIHGHLEQYHLANPGSITHENVFVVAKRMAVILSMRDYLNTHWREMLDSPVTQVSPRIKRGNYGVSCSLSSLDSGWQNPEIQTSTLRADISKQGGFSFRDRHPYAIEVILDQTMDEDETASISSSSL